ncbi:MAG: YqaE/Pmp3 family membrane protein [Chloroflexi bacterium]|nr:YqaE/Pmp3 family membrane protein [Chloroflexota bacterium]
MNLVLIIVVVVFSPLAVLLKRDVGKDLLLNVILTLCVFFPGYFGWLPKKRLILPLIWVAFKL